MLSAGKLPRQFWYSNGYNIILDRNVCGGLIMKFKKAL